MLIVVTLHSFPARLLLLSVALVIVVAVSLMMDSAVWVPAGLVWWTVLCFSPSPSIKPARRTEQTSSLSNTAVGWSDSGYSSASSSSAIFGGSNCFQIVNKPLSCNKGIGTFLKPILEVATRWEIADIPPPPPFPILSPQNKFFLLYF